MFTCPNCGKKFNTSDAMRKHAGKCFRYGVAHRHHRG